MKHSDYNAIFPPKSGEAAAATAAVGATSFHPFQQFTFLYSWIVNKIYRQWQRELYYTSPIGTWIMGTWFIYDLRKLFLIQKKERKKEKNEWSDASKLVCMMRRRWRECYYDWQALFRQLNESKCSCVHLSMRCWSHPRTDDVLTARRTHSHLSSTFDFAQLTQFKCRVQVTRTRSETIKSLTKNVEFLLRVPGWHATDAMAFSNKNFLGKQR